MANNLKFEKKAAVIAMLCEGASIRSIERITGVNRNTIMSLSLRVGKACARILDEKMRGLNCRNIEVDEIWGFIGKKEKRATRKESMIIGVGDVWTFGCGHQNHSFVRRWQARFLPRQSVHGRFGWTPLSPRPTFNRCTCFLSRSR